MSCGQVSGCAFVEWRKICVKASRTRDGRSG